jgi:PAN domain
MRLQFLTRATAELTVLLPVLLLLVLAILLSSSSAQAQTGFDRRGDDYTSFPIRSGDPALCAARCEREARCLAWAFSYPRSENALSICWLKSKVPPRVEDKCCVSGVRGAGVAEPRSGSVEFSIDRVGGDYRNFDTATDASGAACKEACESEKKCRAWTYVRPGYVGASARCYLKDKLTQPRQKPCCISSVVR